MDRKGASCTWKQLGVARWRRSRKGFPLGPSIGSIRSLLGQVCPPSFTRSLKLPPGEPGLRGASLSLLAAEQLLLPRSRSPAPASRGRRSARRWEFPWEWRPSRSLRPPPCAAGPWEAQGTPARARPPPLLLGGYSGAALLTLSSLFLFCSFLVARARRCRCCSERRRCSLWLCLCSSFPPLFLSQRRYSRAALSCLPLASASCPCSGVGG